jgi:hypothetical protein
MTWTIWRLHRIQAIFAAATLAAITLFLLVTGIHLANVYHDALATCAPAHTCAELPGKLFQGDSWMWTLASWTIAVPALLGMFWGAPLLAKELEDGTCKLAWTQTIPRRRWLAANLAWVLVAAAAWGAAIAALLTWWLGPENALQLDRFLPGHFEIQGIAPIGYSLFAVSAGIAAGAWIRRVLPALAVTLAGYTAVRAVVEVFARPHYLAPVTRPFPLGSDGPAGSAWVFANAVTVHGHIVRGFVPGRGGFGIAKPQIPAACLRLKVPGLPLNCMDAHGWRRLFLYQPPGRFWVFQGIETGIFIVLAVVLLALAARRVLTADA